MKGIKEGRNRRELSKAMEEPKTQGVVHCAHCARARLRTLFQVSVEADVCFHLHCFLREPLRKIEQENIWAPYTRKIINCALKARFRAQLQFDVILIEKNYTLVPTKHASHSHTQTQRKWGRGMPVCLLHPVKRTLN